MNENRINLQDCQLDTDNLEFWEGTGDLHWQDNTRSGAFCLTRLLNGRLRFVFALPDDRDISGLSSCRFEGTTSDEDSVSIEQIYFTKQVMRSDLSSLHIGYAESAVKQIDLETGAVSIRFDLTNYRLGRTRRAHFQLDGYDINLSRLYSNHDANRLNEHAIAYDHAPLSASLVINNVPFPEVEQATNTAQKIVSLLSIACRGHVFIAAQYISNEEHGTFYTKFDEPAFMNRKSSRPLISSENINRFVASVEKAQRDRVQNLEIALITDHYLQALAIQSVWPQAVGVYTAMETLKTAFFRQNDTEEDMEHVYWIVPPENFEQNEGMVNNIIQVLIDNFPARFNTLSRPERDSLKDQIRHGLKRRSYKTQLKRMLDILNIEYNSRDLQSFINIRNRLIHDGSPISVETPVEDYDRLTRDAIVIINQATSFFERVLLAWLDYDGPRELFDEGVCLFD